LGLLRDIQHNDGLAERDRRELAESIDRIERHYFAAPEPRDPDLQRIAEAWVAKTGEARHGAS
jgi:hypothetical protein